jgi:hypothetical protein
MAQECTCEDLRAILALQAAFCQHCDLAQWDDLRELLAPDVVLHVFGKDYVGQDDVVAFIARRHLGKHMLSAPAIEIAGDTASVVVDHAFYRYPDLALFGVGVYRDELSKTSGRWLFSRREIEVHGHHADMTAAAKQSVTPIADTMAR